MSGPDRAIAARTLKIEANAVTDNPLLFADAGDVLSGGNFHAEPVAFAADTLALAIAEIGSLSERRIAVLVDPKMSGLPAFLVKNSGLNSGFMIAQVTAAALVSENKTLAAPASVDSIPTSANQEDHVSMATHAARRLSSPWSTTPRRWSASSCWRPLKASIFIAPQNPRGSSKRFMPAFARRAVLCGRPIFRARYRCRAFLGKIRTLRSPGNRVLPSRSES